MARPTWTGAISFGLVNVPVQLYTAVRKHDLRFAQIHDKTRARVRQKRVDAETGEEVAYDDIVKGYQGPDGEYVIVHPGELAELDPEASQLIDIRDFVDLPQIDPIYYDRPYYLAPAGAAAAKPYRLLADAMERKDKVAIAKLVMRNKEYLAAIRAVNGHLVLSTMNFADEVVDPADLALGDLLAEAEPREREIAMAEQLIESLTAEFEPDAYHDEHQQRVTEFLEAKAEGQDVEIVAPSRDTGGVVDLVAALEQSLERAGDGRARADAGETDGGTPDDDYETMSRSELYELAQQRTISGRSSMSKGQLIEALRQGDDASAGAA